MDNTDFTMSFTVDESPEVVFAAINDVRGWWTGDIEGETNFLGATFSFRYEDVHFSRQKISEFEPCRRVVWHVEAARLSFTSRPDEWVGTDITFDIFQRDAPTELRFTHVGLTPRLECYSNCSGAWKFYISESLPKLLTSGVVNPNRSSI